jgi:predicted ATPase
MTTGRITQIRIRGLRAIDNVELDLRGMNVLIGDNGTGKSTILEAFELLRKAGQPGSYVDDVLRSEHGPFQELLRIGSNGLTLGVTVEGDGPKLDYSFTAALAGTSCIIEDERLDVYIQGAAAAPLHALTRTAQSAKWFDQQAGKLGDVHSISPQSLAAAGAAQGLVKQEAFVRLAQALQGIECHPPFDVRPLWQQRELQVRTGPRWPSRPDATERVRRYGFDLPAALTVLRNDRDKWESILCRARAAVGIDLDSLLLDPAGAGQLDIVLKFKSGTKLPLRLLSEGQISFLAMLAVIELGGPRSLLALDEPDIHYHPELVVNLVQILEDLSRNCPVVIATHSDRLLDALEHPAESVLLCERNHAGTISLRRPNAEALSRWLERYSGLGAARADGYEANLFDGGATIGADGAQ